MAEGFALFVLCLAQAFYAAPAAAQTPDGAPESPAIPPPPAPPPPSPAPRDPSTPVDPWATPRGHTPPAPTSPPPPIPPPASPPPSPVPTPTTPTPAPAPTPNPTPSPNLPAPTPDPFPPTPPAPIGPLDAPRYRDAHHDRILLVPTAETSPEGSWTFTDYEIVLLQIGYAVSDRTQITLTGAPPLADEAIVPLDFSVKTVVLRDPRLSIAVMGSATGIFGAEGGSGLIGRAGGVVTLCEPAFTCRVGLSLATNLALLAQFSTLLTGLGGSVRLSRTISLLAEVDTSLPLGPEVGEFNGIMGGSGVRFSKANWGIDLGFFIAGKAGEPVTGIPWIVGTYRVL